MNEFLISVNEKSVVFKSNDCSQDSYIDLGDFLNFFFRIKS